MTTQATTQTNPVPLSQRALLVRLSIAGWTGRKLDRAVTRCTNKSYEAADDAGRYNKLLVAKSALQPCAQLASKARDLLYERTEAWGKDGSRIVAVGAPYESLMRELGAYKHAYEAAARRLIDSLPDLIEESRARLGSMFNLVDYPTQDRLRRAYGFDVEVNKVPTAGDLRLDNVSDVEALRADIERRTQERYADAVGAAWQRVYDCCMNVHDKLATYEARTGGQAGAFRDSLIANVRVLAEALPGLNIAGDPRLDAMAQALIDQLTAVEPAQLRTDAAARAAVRTAAAQLAEQAAAISAPSGRVPAFARVGTIGFAA